MAYEQMYVCKKCGQYVTINPEKALKGCPYCKGELKYIPGKPEELEKMSEEQRLVLTDVHVQNKASRVAEQNEGKQRGGLGGCFSGMVIHIVTLLVGLLVFLVATNAENWLHQNDNFQRKAEISLNEMVEQGQELTPESYISFEARWVLGPFAEETVTRSRSFSDSSSRDNNGGIEATASVDYYYYAVLEDDTLMTIKSSNAKETEILNRMSDWFLSVDGYPMDGETFTVYGKLESMTDKDLRSLYNEYLYFFGLSANDPEVRYLMLDTTEGRYGSYLLAASVAVLIALIVVIRIQIKKNKEKEDCVEIRYN